VRKKGGGNGMGKRLIFEDIPVWVMGMKKGRFECVEIVSSDNMTAKMTAILNPYRVFSIPLNRTWVLTNSL
jgi:hypothetical protein